MVYAESYSIMTDEIDKFCRHNLFSILVKNTSNSDFQASKPAISRKTNSSGKFWLFFLKRMVIWHSVSTFLKGSGYFVVDGNLPSETILP